MSETPASPQPGQPSVVLSDPDEQPAEWLRKHIGKRHTFLGYVTKGEHAADHRLHPERLDHTHER
jgi:hypothetical protein